MAVRRQRVNTVRPVLQLVYFCSSNAHFWSDASHDKETGFVLWGNGACILLRDSVMGGTCSANKDTRYAYEILVGEPWDKRTLQGIWLVWVVNKLLKFVSGTLQRASSVDSSSLSVCVTFIITHSSRKILQTVISWPVLCSQRGSGMRLDWPREATGSEGKPWMSRLRELYWTGCWRHS